jgi:HD-GYP domain-containing protein (c-di-GMP phosphodiesterase class II)
MRTSSVGCRDVLPKETVCELFGTPVTPGRCATQDEAAWRSFRDLLLQNLGTSEWSDGQPSDVVTGVVEMAQHALAASSCTVFLANGHGHKVFFDRRDGSGRSKVEQTRVHNLTGAAAWVVRTRSHLVANEQGQTPQSMTHGADLLDEVTERILCVPLMAGLHVLGAMEVTRGFEAEPFTDRDAATAQVIGATAGVAIENTRLRYSIEEGYRSTIRALASAIDAKDPYTCGHSQRVAQYSLVCGLVLSLNAERMHTLETAAILHDVGKIGIDDAILRKPRRLTAAELAMVKDHPVIGAAIVHDVGALSGAVQFILHHHESYDGSGYPHGLSGESIPLGARIIAVADAFDSMTTERPYRKAMTINEAMSELLRCRGTQFCPEALDAFAVGFARYYNDLPRQPLRQESRQRVAVTA